MSDICESCDPSSSDSNIVRNRLDQSAWEDRLDNLVRNQTTNRDYLFAISPKSKQFMIHPALNSDTVALVVWDGLKMDFDDGDVVPWPEHAAEAVGAYVKSKILRSVDKRPDLAQVEYGTYIAKRLALWREWNEAQHVDGKDSEFDITQVPNPEPLSDFGAQAISFLATVTQLEGDDNTALAAIPTTGITPNFAVSFLNATTLVMETWVLRAGTDADAPESGVLRPNDFNEDDNGKVWTRNG